MTEQDIWVMTAEASEITGYNAEYLKKLSNKITKLPEDQRRIKIRKRGGRYELWLPDLLKYIEESGYGPHNPPHNPPKE